MSQTINIFWFRRDLRLNDNRGLWHALSSGLPVIPLFIFDKNILQSLPGDDRRVNFIYKTLSSMNRKLLQNGSGLHVYFGTPPEVFENLLQKYRVNAVFTNHDDEPYALERDAKIREMLSTAGVSFHTFGDHLLFERSDILKPEGSPYVVFTPYSKKWLELKARKGIPSYPSETLTGYFSDQTAPSFPALEEMGFRFLDFDYPPDEPDTLKLKNYAGTRNFPALDATSRLGLHLRFGTVSTRECIRTAEAVSTTWLNELIWREFFAQIMYHFPYVVNGAFRKEYDRIEWLNREEDFVRWCEGTTGFPMVDAGMRELKQTGFMHNRVRMVTASFLTKHLLIDWRWGEAWFAENLLDFELASNNGNWQWAAGSGCDAAPYFRIFNPAEQARKFDKDEVYIRKWIPEYGTSTYPRPMVNHSEARERCLKTYARALKP